MITLFWLTVGLAVTASLVACIDGTLRLSTKKVAARVVGAGEIVVALLFLPSLYFGVFLAPTVMFALGAGLAAALTIAMVVRGRAGVWLPAFGVLLIVAWFLLWFRWVEIPGIQ